MEGFAKPIQSNRSESVYTLVTEWLDSVGSEQGKPYRSDRQLLYSCQDPVSRQRTRSAPEMMSRNRDVYGFSALPRSRSAVPSHPGSLAQAGISSGTSANSLVENPLYQERNLADNNMYMRLPGENFLEHTASLMEHICRGRDSPSPPPEQGSQETRFQRLQVAAAEYEIEECFRDKILLGFTEGLKVMQHHQMSRCTVPNTGSKYRVSNPIPDMLYGYDGRELFRQHESELMSMDMEIVTANTNRDLMYPFLVVECKGDGHSGGRNMWAAMAQYLTASACCVNMAEHLNNPLRERVNHEARLINSATFSVAVRGTDARVYITWRHKDRDYYVGEINRFWIRKYEDYKALRKQIWKIIAWGKAIGLKEINNLLDSLIRG